MPATCATWGSDGEPAPFRPAVQRLRLARQRAVSRRPGTYAFELDGESSAERAGDAVEQIERRSERLPSLDAGDDRLRRAGRRGGPLRA